MQEKEDQSQPVLVTGATGYVAGRLIPVLIHSGYRVRAMGRSIEKMACRPWAASPAVELVRGDVMDPKSLEEAVKGCKTIYYLVHSMISQKHEYRNADRTGAENMVKAAANQKADHIIYLGGLGDIDHKNISRHLISRNEVGRILQQGPVPATVLRAAMILGAGSASFEILRYLTEHLPVMITPRWVTMPTQPIAISNVITYLKGCMEHPEVRGETLDIGGPDVLTYKDLFLIYARQAGLKRPLILPVPFLYPKLSALWIHLVTPVPAEIARPLAEGLSLPTACTEDRITEIVPQELISCSEAISRALDRVRQEQVDTCWADAGLLEHPEWSFCGDSDYTGGTILECGYRAKIRGTSGDVWAAVKRIGGRTGYYGADTLWRIRGVIDVFAGGVGLSRGRRSKDEIRVGDALDFWRVLEAVPPEKLLLLAEMKTPGQALLEIRIHAVDSNSCELVLLSRFLPRGLPGLIYWYTLYPFHQFVFTSMCKGIAAVAELELEGPPVRFTPKIKDACELP